MPDTINSEMIKLAREARGYSQADLCEALHVAQGTVSKIENRLMECSEELLARIATELKYPETFFRRRDSIFPSSILYYRRKLSVGKKVLSKSEARMNIVRMAIERLLEQVSIPEVSLPTWDVEQHGSPDVAAQFLREHWRIPKGRIEKLIKVIEANGILVYQIDFETDKLDGISFYTQDGRPIIFVNRNLPGDRMRLTIAHELGHLMMHINKPIPMDRDVEKEAFSFASEFLVPFSEFRRSSISLDLKFFADQKRYWMVAMSALIYKAREKKMISENQAKYLFSQMSSLGYRKQEPIELGIEREESSLLSMAIDLHKSELGYTVDDLAKIVYLSKSDYEAEFVPRPFGLRVLRRRQNT